MAVIAMTEPETAKATTTGAAADLVHFSMPIEKSEDTKTINPVDGTPDLEIWGKVTDGTLDSDLQVVDPEASLKWIKTWYDTKANIRMGHDPKRPVGRGLDIDGHYVKALIAEPVAKHLIRSKVLNDWSVGIINPEIRSSRDPQFRHLDPTGKAIHGVITDRTDGLTGLAEISVVDRGSNYGTAFQLVKAAAGGGFEWTGKLTAPDDVLAKYAAPAVTKDSGLTTVELPSDMKLPVTPAILAKMATLKRNLVLQERAMLAADDPDATVTITKGVTCEEDLDPAHLAMKAAEAAAYKRDIDTATRRRLAGEGKALPNLSYPIENAEDLQNAATLAWSGHGDVGAATRLIGRRAKDLGVPNPMKKPKGKKASKAAEADVTKCMKCDGTGMVDGKDCPDCKGRLAKALRKLDEFAAVMSGDAVEKKKGKMRAVCPACGAKQNPDHKHCPECGNALPERAIQVKKNHDFVCLGCGKDLDKGEPHCPGCGKQNPGYLPEADQKIPANENADKSAGKDRVPDTEQITKGRKGKGGKKGKKGMPFGGNQAKPFGAKDTDDDDKPDAKAEKRKKGGKGRSPAEGVKGQETMGLPPHREPDGAPVEQFENDSALEDGDQEMKTAMRHKSSGLEPQLAVLHDLTCPAFSPASVDKCLPHASFAGIDTAYWQKACLDAAAESDLEKAVGLWNEAQVLSRAAVTLKTADPDSLHRIRAAGHEAFLEANKAFRDATPGPGSAPTPAGYVAPGSFRRPYISGGHAAASPQHEGARTFPVVTDHPQAQDFHRGYLDAGYGSESPANDGRSEPAPTGSAGMPESRATTAAGMQQRDYEQAVSTMHDHLSRIAPGMCPMSPPMGHTQGPAHPVPDPVGMIEPHSAKASKADRAALKAKRKARLAKKAARAAALKAKARRRKVQAMVVKGTLSVDEARVKLGLEPFGTPETAQKAAFTPTGPEPVAPAAALDADAITAAVKTATAPLAKRIREQDKALRKTAKLVAAIGDQPDTRNAPFRGAGTYVNKTSAAPAGPQTAAEAAALAQTTQLQQFHNDWRNSPDPEVREAAYRAINKTLGLNPVTDNGPTPIRPRTAR